MDKIKIVVHSLGKIRDAEIEISPLTIFCGDSGLGKSYLAMLVHYLCHSVGKTIKTYSIL